MAEGLGPDRIRIAQQRRLIARKAERDGAGDQEAEAGAQVSQPGDAAEQEADSVADQVADGMHEGEGSDGAEASAEGATEEQAAPEELDEAKQLVNDEENSNGDSDEIPPEVEAMAPPVGEGDPAPDAEREGESAESADAEAAGHAEAGSETDSKAANAPPEPKEKAPEIGAKLESGTISLSKPKPGKTVTSPPGKTGTGNQGIGPKASNLPVKVRDQQAEQKEAGKNAAMPPDQKRPAETLGKKEMEDIEARVKAGDRTLTKDQIEAFKRTKRMGGRRAEGVSDFWAREAIKLQKGEPPSRNWSPEQKADILAGKAPKGPDGKPMEGHHKFGVKDFPQVAATGANIAAATKKEHRQRWHGGDTKADTDGTPRNPKHPEEF